MRQISLPPIRRGTPSEDDPFVATGDRGVYELLYKQSASVPGAPQPPISPLPPQQQISATTATADIMELTRVGQTGRTLGSSFDTEENVWTLGTYSDLTERDAWGLYCSGKLSRDPELRDEDKDDILRGLELALSADELELAILGFSDNVGRRIKDWAEVYDRALDQDSVAESKLFLKASALVCDGADIDCTLKFKDYLTIMSTILTDLSEIEDPMPGVNLYPQTEVTNERIAVPSAKQKPGTATRVETKAIWTMSEDNIAKTKSEIKDFLTTVASWNPDWKPDLVPDFHGSIREFVEKATNNTKGLTEVELLGKYYTDRSRMKAPTEKQAIDATEAAFRLWLRAADVPEPSEVDESAASSDEAQE